jgi:hypothetical protein
MSVAAATPTADLNAALAFVIERISVQAEVDAKPLDEDERYFLTHLPTEPTNPTIPGGVADEYGPPMPMLRDFPFEKLCNLAKNAHRMDIQNSRPGAAGQWDFAASVLSLNGHPMSWLLGWAGIKPKKTVRACDRVLLLLTGLSVVLVSLIGGIGLLSLTERYAALWRWTLNIIGGLIFSGLMILLYFGVKRLEQRQAIQTAEKYRCEFPVRNSESSKF